MHLTPKRYNFDPYDLQSWTGDVMRSWGEAHPREAFTWLYATRTGFGYSLGDLQTFLRVTRGWARASLEGAEEAEKQALSLDVSKLRQEAIAGVIAGNILRGDVGRMNELMEELSDDRLRRQVEELYRKNFG